ncbi:MAG: hypothetical protein K2F83_07145 [Oscillospiraceae bacterium]|nr:hypothetical protein [Oscillospiraceae bacterium]
MSARPTGRRLSGELQHQAEHARTRKGPSVLSYLVVLFIVAFLLLLIAYFQQQRVNSEATDDAMKQSASALQSIQNLLAENEKLREEVDRLDTQVADLTQANNALESSHQAYADAADRELAAMDYFWRIQRLYSRGSRKAALDLAKEFEATNLPPALPRTNYSNVEGTSPYDQYQALLDALNYRPAP